MTLEKLIKLIKDRLDDGRHVSDADVRDLVERLEKAETVISYYADKKNYCAPNMRIAVDLGDCKGTFGAWELCDVIDDNGKMAREFLKK